jgi:hypothetical protein
LLQSWGQRRTRYREDAAASTRRKEDSAASR